MSEKNYGDLTKVAEESQRCINPMKVYYALRKLYDGVPANSSIEAAWSTMLGDKPETKVDDA